MLTISPYSYSFGMSPKKTKKGTTGKVNKSQLQVPKQGSSSDAWSLVSTVVNGFKQRVWKPSKKLKLPDKMSKQEQEERFQQWHQNLGKAEAPVEEYPPAEQVDVFFKDILGDK